TNQCQTMSAWQCPTTNTYQICGDFNNDSCLEWSQTYTCDTGYTCSASGKTCQAVGDNPTTGTLTATKTTALTGENVSFTVKGYDTDGITKVCLLDGEQQTPVCQNVSTYTWNLTKQTPGTYFFYGYVYGKRPNGEQVERTTDPFFVKVNFQGQAPVCNNTCQSIGQWQCLANNAYQVCGDFNNDSCLEWSSQYACSGGTFCSATERACIVQNDNPTSINLTSNKTQAIVEENVDFTLQASDQDGIEKICFIDQAYSQSPECFNCSGNSCQKIFTKTKQAPGLYVFSGYALAKDPQGQTKTISAAPVSILFISPTPTCQDDCPFNGKTECFNYNSVRTCGYYDNDSCLEWSSSIVCPEGQSCTGAGICSPVCYNQCPSAGAKECYSGGVRTCQMQNNGCLGWSSPTDCGTDQNTEEYRCANNNQIVERKIIKQGCLNGQCFTNTQWIEYDNCSSRGNVCNPLTNRCSSQWLTVSCYAAPSTAQRGELSWVIAQVAGGVGPYQYSWSGDFSGNEQTVSKTFYTQGTYTANLTVTAGNQTKTASCSVYVSNEIAPYANHPGSGNIWVSNTSPYTGETISINISGNDEDGINELQAYYQNAWHGQSVSGNSATRSWQITEYTPGNYQYCGKIVARTMTGQRDVSYTSPRCIEIFVRNR
ncbi:MAG: PKD domain-containing protein, partial [Candidatus Pacebacteria bacterium]|nr:PKD domain-containing protein [Candidatus Paceibacterota bacterium]